MRKKICLVLTMFCVASLAFGSTASSQTKRRQQPKRSRASRQTPLPRITLGQLTEEQQQALSSALDEAQALEVTYKYDSRRYADEATRVARICWDTSKLFPEGKVKYALSEMGDAHYNAGLLFAKLFPMPKTETREERAMRELIEASEALDRQRGGTMAEERRRAEEEEAKEEVAHIAKTLERYGVQHLAPYQAQAAIFDIAVGFRKILSDALARHPSSRQ